MNRLNAHKHEGKQLYFHTIAKIAGEEPEPRAVPVRVTAELYEQARTFCQGFVMQQHIVRYVPCANDAGGHGLAANQTAGAMATAGENEGAPTRANIYASHDRRTEWVSARALEPEDVLVQLLDEPAAANAAHGLVIDDPVDASLVCFVGFTFGVDARNGRIGMFADPFDPATWQGSFEETDAATQEPCSTTITLSRPVSVRAMREADAACIAAGTPARTLMKRAGKRIFAAANLLCFSRSGQSSYSPRTPYWKGPVCILCGTGNNAGDGYVVANMLAKRHIAVTIVLAEERFSACGAHFFKKCRKKGVPVQLWEPGMSLCEYGVIVDCLLGTGFAGAVREPYAGMINAANEARRAGTLVVSADINSGLSGDTGLGGLFVESDLTVSVGSFKTGHFAGLADIAMQARMNANIGIPCAEERR